MSTKVPRLITSFIPSHYTLRLDPDRDTKQLVGSVTITGKKVGRPSGRLTFHQKGVKVTKATIIKHDKKGDQVVTVERINHHASANEVRLHVAEQLYSGSYSVTMDFEGSVQDSMHGVYMCNYEIDGKKLAAVSTQFESHFAREGFPCIDEPEAKATFDFTLLSPLKETVLSNTPIKEQTEQDGKLVTTFETTPKMSTYLLAFVYGDLQSKSTTTKDGVTSTIYSTKAHPIAALDHALEAGARALEFFNEYYGVPYPLAKSDHVAVPDFAVGAMENWGLITYRESCLLMDPASASQSNREWISTIMSHELSHQWFGDLVTMKWWDYLWLNESFANVMEYVAVDAVHPEWHVWNGFVASEGLAALRRDSIAGVQAVQVTVNHPDEISSIFDPSIVYAKGGRLLNMLMHYIGTDAFRSGLKSYFIQHAYSNTTGDDLWAAFSKSSGKDIASFMDPWLTRSGYPVVTVTQNGKDVQITQSHFLLDAKKADADRIWPVPLLGGSDLPELFDKASLSVDLPADTYVHINQGAIGHYIVHYTEQGHQEALAKLVEDKSLTIPERLMLLHDSSQLSRAGIQSFAETLELLKHYEHEDSDSVWDIMSLVLSDVRRFVDTDERFDEKIKSWVRVLIEEQFERLGWEEKAGEPNDDTKLRAGIIGLGIYSGHPAITSEALARFEQFKQKPETITGELRGVILGAAVRNPAPGAFAYLLELEEKTDDIQLKQDIQGALTGTKSKTEAEELLGRLKDPKKVRAQDVDHWIVYLMRNRYSRELAWKWLRDNWDWIEQTFGHDQTYDNFPRYAASPFNTRKGLEEYRAFFEPKADQPQLTRNIAIGIEEIANRVDWLESDLQNVKKFFTLS
jgi:aminopeptidase N